MAEKLSIEAGKDIERIVEDDTINIDGVTEKIQTLENNLKFRSFGKFSLNKTKVSYLNEKGDDIGEGKKAQALLEN